MPPRTSSESAGAAVLQPARSSGTPHTRRSASHPKSSRQQFSACGACRMRRVRCDLKDLPISFVGPHPACSNCKERGIKCVDEFAEVKAVKLLRRGRRLQQVEAIYGKIDQYGEPSPTTVPQRASKIPSLHPDFFASPFWRWFSIQRPILDGKDFADKYTSHCKGSQLGLTSEGALIAMLLVTWAASFGLNERGHPEDETCSNGSLSFVDNAVEGPRNETDLHSTRRRHWKNKCENFLLEILERLDLRGVLRRPSLDGVRLLLLLLPLMEEAQPLERLAIHEATLSQVQALCCASGSNSNSSNFEDATIRARIFWYAYTQEGILTGIRGGRFVLNNEDLDTFQRTLPSTNLDRGCSATPSPPSPTSVGPSSYNPLQQSFNPDDESYHKPYVQLMRAASIPLDLGNVCRKIHGVLTGIKASRRAEDHGVVDAHGMREIWRDLDRCWQELESLKRAPLVSDSVLHRLDIKQYVDGWQIFIFEIHNVVRESLKHFGSNSASRMVYGLSDSRPSSQSSGTSPYLSPQQLHIVATRKCLSLLPRIIQTLRFYSHRENTDISGIFGWDSGLVRDGCFFAAYLSSSLEGEVIDLLGENNKQSELKSHVSVDDAVSICLNVIESMRWGFSKSEEREETIKMIWKNRKLYREGRSSPLHDTEYPHALAISSQMHLNIPIANIHSNSMNRRFLPPLNFSSQRVGSSLPTCSPDIRHNWPSYTPPGTATSVATSSGTSFSRASSPVFANMTTFKMGDDMFYQGADLDQFTYNAPLSSNGVREHSNFVSEASTYGHRHSPMGPTSNYVTPNAFNPAETTILNADYPPQYGESCTGVYN